MSALVNISVAELRRRIEFLQGRSFAVSDELRELLMRIEPHNQKALDCKSKSKAINPDDNVEP